MKTVYIVIDTIAVGPLEIDENKPLLEQIRDTYPDIEHAEPHEKDSPVIIATTKK